MKVVDASYALFPEESLTKKIEHVARVCYKSEDKIGEGTDLNMLKMLIDRKHYAMLEHKSLVFKMPSRGYAMVKRAYSEFKTEFLDTSSTEISSLRMNFTDTTLKDDTHRYIVSANLRGWIEFFNFCVEERFIRYYAPYLQDIAEIIKNETRGIVDYTPSFLELGDRIYGVSLITDFSKLSYPERMIHETFTVLFSVDRGVTHEVVRMRDSSFAQESTRYCNYSQGRFGGEIIYIKPVGYDWWEEGKKACWLSAMANAERSYLELTSGYGESAQIARGILPHNVKADIVVTTNLNEWRHIFELRACDKTGPAHPQMKEVMCPLCTEMQEKYPFAFGDLKVKFLTDGK